MALRTLEHFFTGLSSFQTPALVWYSQGSERVELSGRVLENWVSKTANFLVDECEVATADTLALTAETHWRSLVVALAALRVGAQIEFIGKPYAGEAQTVITFHPQELEDLSADYPVLMDRGPLSPRFMGELPAGALDYCALVPSHDDVYSGLEIPTDTDLAFTGLHLSFADLLSAAEKAAQVYRAEESRSCYLPAPKKLTPGYLVELLGLWSQQKTLLLTDPSVDWSEQRLQRLLTSERAKTLYRIWTDF